ncbi:MAG: Pr6Pr family membrane protein [Anaerolineales bacterium]|nr:Pr6Pr family membrane protein [Anaerolineales bacterium]
MNKRNVLIFGRLFFGWLTLFAVFTQFGVSMSVGFSPLSYFSYFTNISNILVSLIFIIAAYRLWSERKPTLQDDLIRGAGVVYITVVGLVYLALLRGQDLGALLPWVNTQTHIVMPLVVIADWLWQPPKHKLEMRHALYWLVFPLIYLAYSLVRGALIGWYPYEFLNPGHVGGYGGVALYCLGILAAFFVISWLWITLANRRHAARA